MALPAREKLKQSEFVFRARVERLGASTMPELPATDSTVVVLIDEVYQSPAILGSLAGKSITLVKQQTAPLRAGQEVLFLARGWLYGESIAVVEVGREQGNMDSAELRQHIDAETQARMDEVLNERVRDASAVVVGKVVQTVPVQAVDPATLSEHSPLWGEATIQVVSVEKGSLPSKEVVVLYPQSRDVMWYRAPKFHTGQQGVWILRRQRIEGTDREEFTALDTLDFQRMENLPRIKRFISGPQ